MSTIKFMDCFYGAEDAIAAAVNTATCSKAMSANFVSQHSTSNTNMETEIFHTVEFRNQHTVMAKCHNNGIDVSLVETSQSNVPRTHNPTGNDA